MVLGCILFENTFLCICVVRLFYISHNEIKYVNIKTITSLRQIKTSLRILQQAEKWNNEQLLNYLLCINSDIHFLTYKIRSLLIENSKLLQ